MATAATTESLELDEATRQAYAQQGREYLDKIRSQIAEVADANQHLLQAGAGPWICPGPVTFSALLFKLDINGRFLYPPGPFHGHVKFHAELPGFGLAEGMSVGISTFVVNRNDLVGEVSCEVHFIGVGPGGLQINWKRGKQIIGSFVGGGLIEGAGLFIGTGRFDLD